MIKGLVLALLLSVFFVPEWGLTLKIPEVASDLRVDMLKNIYLIQKGALVKYDASGKRLTEYSNKLIGEGLLVDVTNPLKVLLFSPDQMKVIFLDSRLGEIRDPIRLLNRGYEQVTVAATSHSNGFWIYDAIKFEMIRFDQNLEVMQRSANLSQLLRIEFYPNYMVEVNNRVYLNDPDHGVFVFDIFGNYLKRLPIKGMDRLSIANDRLFYARGNSLYATHLKTLGEETVPIPYKEGLPFDVGKAIAVTGGQQQVNIFTPKP